MYVCVRQCTPGCLSSCLCPCVFVFLPFDLSVGWFYSILPNVNALVIMHIGEPAALAEEPPAKKQRRSSDDGGGATDGETAGAEEVVVQILVRCRFF